MAPDEKKQNRERPDPENTARDYYDSKDAQTFYSTVWGKHNTHIGRYDLVEADPDLAELPLIEKIRKAQLLHEESLMNTIREFFPGKKVQCLDMGCGFGGLLRTMASSDMLLSATGVDISGEMIASANRLTTSPILTFLRESYMKTSLPDESLDLCISMDAFLHVGPGQHDKVLREAHRLLRPGGRLVFSDIVARPDAPKEAEVLYERLGLSSFATVAGYFEKGGEEGFGEFAFEEHSGNVSKHYGSVLRVLEGLWEEGGIEVSEAFMERMAAGLVKWRDLAPECLEWGVISMRKLEGVNASQ